MSQVDRDLGKSKFGTFGGVFTPCTLTILGVIMFLRFGFVVGQAGVVTSVLIVLAAVAISLLTALSLAAIATNTRVKGGGAYYLISRSLGVEFGGAIGLVFFLGQAISVAMYVIGFAEAFTGFSATSGISPVLVATVTNVVVCVCVYIGAGWTIRIQYFILALLGASLAAFYIGAFQDFDPTLLKSNLRPSYTEGENAFTMFALFFPAVTGIMAGANMSGDLRDPAKSIPLGTLSAIFVTGAVYLSLALLLGSSRSSDVLQTDSSVVNDIAAWPFLITAGVFAATLSSALGSMMGAPRILQAFARDHVFPSLRAFGVGSGESNEPRRGVLLTFAIAQVCIMAADLNSIAPLITMFFMITYGLLNLATFYESVTKNPSYRPRFRYCHWLTSLAGAAGCVLVMFLIDWRWAVIAISSMTLLHWYIGRKEIRARWGDLQSGVLFERARRNLLRLEQTQEHPKNWRPIVLALGGASWDRPYLAVYGHWLTSGHGILILGQVIQGEVENRLARRDNQKKILDKFIQAQELEAFSDVVVAPYLSDGIEAMAQCQGIGALRPNTLLLGWPSDIERAAAFGATLRTIDGLRKSILTVRIADEPTSPWDVPTGTIDVWWRGHKNGELMLLLAHLLTQNDGWRTRPIRLMRVIQNDAGREQVDQHLAELLDASRISGTTKVVVSSDINGSIQMISRNASLVILGFEVPEMGQEEAFYERMEEIAGPLQRVVFVDSIGGMSLES